MARSAATTTSGDPYGLKRFKHVVRKYSTSVPRHKWRTPRKRIPLTAIERGLAKAKQQSRKASLVEALDNARKQIRGIAEALQAQFQDHSIDHYFRLVTQTSAAASKRRKASRWMAFLRAELANINNELPVGEKKKIDEVATVASMKWQSMTQEEQVRYTDPLLKDLEELREMKRLSVHNVPSESFGDTTQTLQHIEDEMRSLHARTGTEMILVAVRGDVNDYLRPLAIFSSERSPNFFRVACNMELATFALRLEAYCIAGVARNYVQETSRMKSETASLIATKLEAAANAKVRMIYTDFDRAVTLKHGVELIGWPLPKFCSPSELACRYEITILREAFLSGQAYFRKMSVQQWEEWQQKRILALQSVPPTPTLSEPLQPGLLPPLAADHSPPPPDSSCTATGSPSGPAPDDSLDVSAGSKRAVSSADDQEPAKRARVAFVNAGITDVNGSATFVINQKARKTRKDKGTKRGSRKSKENAPPVGSAESG